MLSYQQEILGVYFLAHPLDIGETKISM